VELGRLLVSPRPNHNRKAERLISATAAFRGRRPAGRDLRWARVPRPDVAPAADRSREGGGAAGDDDGRKLTDSRGVLRRPVGQDVLLVGGRGWRAVGLRRWVLRPLLGRNSCTRVLALLETHDTWLFFRLSLEAKAAAVQTDAARAYRRHCTTVRDTGRVSSSADAEDDSRFP
jgi:hypothetical protein